MIKLELNEVIEKLSHIVNPDYEWPDIPLGWQLEFIAHSDEDVDMDLLHPVSARFWSEDNGHFVPPMMNNGKSITATVLKKYGVLFMTTFGEVKLAEQTKKFHLNEVK